MYTVDEDYSSNEETRNKCMSDCPELHGARQLSLQREKMELLLSLPGLVPVRPIRQSRLGRKTSGNWSPQMELKYMHLNEGAIGGILRGGDGQDGKIRGVGVGV